MTDRQLGLALLACLISIGATWTFGALELNGLAIAASLPAMGISTWVLLAHGFRECVIFAMALFLLCLPLVGVFALIAN